MLQLGKEILRSGADLIMGHGSHCLQEVEFWPEGAFISSIGNFVYNSPGRYLQEGGLPYSLIARLTVGEGECSVRLYPTFCDNRLSGFNTRPVNALEARTIMGELRRRAVDADVFNDRTILDQDAEGFWYLGNRRPISPRFIG
jgi:poly-gamma-glutamate capsule biosynthesis protein CapA/YwtB (metallophosphatase superfamily)